MTAPKSPEAPWRNFYGRNKGKTLRPAQERDMAELLPKLSPGPVAWEDNPGRTPLDFEALFQGRDVWLEIGFGGGEHLAHLAVTHPDLGFIGCEPYVNGVAMLLGKIRQQNIQNVKVHDGDARDLFDVIPDASLSRVYLLYPDPWPKARHHRRRFVNPEFIDPLATKMKPGAELRVATDIEDYVRQTLEVVARHDEFTWLAEGPADWRQPWEGWISTRYEKKALREGRKPHYLRFERK